MDIICHHYTIKSIFSKYIEAQKRRPLRAAFSDTVRRRGLEPPTLSGPPPQDGVSTNFTTCAKGPHSVRALRARCNALGERDAELAADHRAAHLADEVELGTVHVLR